MIESRSFRAALILLTSLLLLLPAGLASARLSSGGAGGIGTGDNPAGNGGSGGKGGKGKGSKSDLDGTFPLLGAHTYGDGLGAGRGHQGQDLLSKCGKPIVVAVGGRVEVVDYQASGAGNHVVIKGKETKLDYVYMHLAEEARVSEGDRVEAGQKLGRVGTTGSSTTCHLHFEEWSAPGWYEGGEVLDPEPDLRRWDKQPR